MDLRSWGKKWNDASLRRIVTMPENPPLRVWPLLGMLALGLVVGAGLGGYIASQRPQVKRLARYAHRMGDQLAALGKPEAKALAVVATSPRSNHRRKATSEV